MQKSFTEKYLQDIISSNTKACQSLLFDVRRSEGKLYLSNTVTSSETHNDGNNQALETIRKEKKIIEAIITEANVLHVSVKDDGTRRDGFTQYLCLILKENLQKPTG